MKKLMPTPTEIAKRRLSKHPIMKIEQHEQNNVLNKENIVPKIKLNKKQYHRKDMDIDHIDLRNPYILRRSVRTFYKSGKRKKSPAESSMMADVHTVCDIDPTFYKVVEGRPLRSRDDIKVYMCNIRDTFLFKANAAYLLEQILKIDSSFAFEMAEHDKIYNLIIVYKDEFVKFVKASYNIANEVQNRADKIALQLKDKSEELDALGFQYVELSNRLTDLTINYKTLSIYRHFLDKLTPLWLTIENISSGYFAQDTRYSLSGQASILSSVSVPLDLDWIYKECLTKVDSEPYFTDPQQLLDVFEYKRIQSLNYLQLGVQTANILTKISKCRDAMKTKIEDYVTESTGCLDIYNASIKALEEKSETYEAIFYKILFGEFHELYASFDACKLFTCVQYVHTRLFGDMEDPKDKIKTLMFNIERHYFDLFLKLDNLDVEIVKKAEHQAYAEDMEKMNKAFRAKRILRESDILSRALYASFEPPRRRQ